MARQVADQQVVASRQLEREIGSLAEQDIALFAHRGELLFVESIVGAWYELIGRQVGLDDDNLTEIIRGDLNAGDRVIVAEERKEAGARSSVPRPRL